LPKDDLKTRMNHEYILMSRELKHLVPPGSPTSPSRLFRKVFDHMDEITATLEDPKFLDKIKQSETKRDM